MNEEPLHPWIEPELEARIVALVLGEASDFEREELERLIGERPELAAFKHRMETVHGRLSGMATGQPAAEEGDWKLSAEKRSAVLAVIGGETEEKPANQVALESFKLYKSENSGFFRNLGKIAAVLCVVGLLGSLLLPATQTAREAALSTQSSNSLKQLGLAPGKASGPEDASGLDFTGGAALPSRYYLSDDVKYSQGKDTAAGVERDYEVDSKSALSGIRGSLDHYTIRGPQDFNAYDSTAEMNGPVDGPGAQAGKPSSGAGKTSSGDSLFAYSFGNTRGGEDRADKNADSDGVPDKQKLRQGFSEPLIQGAGSQRATSDNGSLAFPKPADGPGYRIASAPAEPANPADSIAPSTKEGFSGSSPTFTADLDIPFSDGSVDKGTATVPAAPELPALTDSLTVTLPESNKPESEPGSQGDVDGNGLERFGEQGITERSNAKRIVNSGSVSETRVETGKHSGLKAERTTTKDSKSPEETEDSFDGADRSSESIAWHDRRTSKESIRSNAKSPQMTNGLREGERSAPDEGKFVADGKNSGNDDDGDRGGFGSGGSDYVGLGGGGGLGGGRGQYGYMRADKGRPAEHQPGQMAAKNIDGRLNTNTWAKTAPSPLRAPGRSGGAKHEEVDKEVEKLFDPSNRPADPPPAPTDEPMDSREGLERIEKLNIAKGEKKTLAERRHGLVTNGDVDITFPEGRDSNRNDNRGRPISNPATGDALGQPEAKPSTPQVELPEIVTKESETVASVPDGGTVILGGMKRHSEGRRRSLGGIEILEGTGSPTTITRGDARLEFQKQVKDSLGDLAKSIQRNTWDVAGNGKNGGDELDEISARRQLELYSMKNESARQLDKFSTTDGKLSLGREHGSSFRSVVPGAIIDESESMKTTPAKKPAPPAGLNEKTAEAEAFSTFSLHVSDVSFKLAQAALAKGQWPEAAKVRIEEFVNALDYGDPMPSQSEKVACRLEQAIHPFLQQRNLLRVSMRTAAEGRSSNTPLRLTFLLDNSGSMERADRQQTVRRAFALLAQQLTPADQVTLISFARQPRLLADKVSGAKSRQLVELIDNLPSEGGTNFEAALQLAFEKARSQQVQNAQNRVILLTDGAVNLGDADPKSLAQIITTMRSAGIAFDAAGISANGLNDEILEALTRNGDGRYYLLDQPEDADDGFARQIAGALRPAAKNVKVQIEFNPRRVGRYKLLGFEKHRLKKEDFRNDKVDAAEMAAAEAGVAVYQFEAKPDGEGDVGLVSVRFRDMSTGEMVENRWPIPYEANAPRADQATPSLRIAISAALFAAKLRGEPLGETVDLKTLSHLIAGLPERDRNVRRVQQLQQMIQQARQVSGK